MLPLLITAFSLDAVIGVLNPSGTTTNSSSYISHVLVTPNLKFHRSQLVKWMPSQIIFKAPDMLYEIR